MECNGIEEVEWAVDILKAATQLESLACGESLLAKVVNARALTQVCGRLTLTLINVQRGVEYEAKHVTHLRLCAGTYSTQDNFPAVTSLYLDARDAPKDEKPKLEYQAMDKWVENLERLVMTEKDGKRLSLRELDLGPEVKRDGQPDVFSVPPPVIWTEYDIWRADVVGAVI
ncbi:hypothetical protein P691DRAFT_808831 [Macrolepiota fuliginosa MF-IS2]|uniref:Uncharacterized protein n=1 Tax=Macrolepiota fuliginosa MF-IS2 TaxID=1400762 RepID=A0A9P6BZC9_9AGAR|nr:hypothetical protein P691DRAFT_808831 [Macrolepiota fuliginosa MF-IS2]